MKKKILLLATFLILLLPGKNFAQKEFRLTPFYGYTFQDRIPTYEGDGYVRDASTYGGLFQFLPNEGVSLSFLYKYSKPEFDFNSYSYYIDDIRNVKTAISYYMFGVGRYFQGTDEVVAPFATFYAGWTTWNPDQNYNTFSRFTFGIDLGVSIKATDNIGFNIRSELMMPIQGFGTGIYCGTGGCGASFETVTSITQFGFTGGVEIRLAPKAKADEFYTY